MKAKTIALSGLHCASCSLLIEGTLEDLGVEASVDYKNQKAQVLFDERVISFQKITEAIRALGYGVSEAS